MARCRIPIPRATLTCLCTLALVTSCSDDKPGKPQPVLTTVHAPWEDREAEEMAVIMGGELAASRELYEQVVADLDAIRTEWESRIGALSSIAHTPTWQTDQLEIAVDRETYAAIKQQGFPPDWDSLNQSLRIDRAQFHDSVLALTLTFDARLSPQLLARRYQSLPGVRWAKMVRTAAPLIGPSSVDGFREADARLYLFSRPESSCEKLCETADIWLFRVAASQSDSLGSRKRGEPLSHTDSTTWWNQGLAVRELALGPGTFGYFPDSDLVAPEIIAGVEGEPINSSSLIVRWLATGDDGMSGSADGYEVAIVGPDIGERRITPDGFPRRAGLPESLLVENLSPERTYRIVVRAFDEQGNWSIASTPVWVRTLPQWTDFTTQNSGLSNNAINALAMDNANRLWCATAGGGISRFDGENWSVIFTVEGRSVVDARALAFDAGRDMVWCGAEGGALCGIRVAGGSHMSFSSNAIGFNGAAIIAIDVGPDGDIWCSNGSNGAARWNGADWTSYTTANSGIASNVVLDIDATVNGEIWFATNSGLSRLDGLTWTTYTKSNSGIGVNLVSALVVTDNGNVWCGHQDKAIGLSTYSNGTWWTYGHADSLVSTYVNTIIFGPPKSPWVGTTLGLSRPSFSWWNTYLTDNSPIIDNTITALAYDSRNTLWIGTPKGLSRYEMSIFGR